MKGQVTSELQPPARPLLPGLYRVIPAGDDGVQLRSAGRVITVKSEGMAAATAALLRAMDGRLTLAELAEANDLELAFVEGLAGRLAASGLVQNGDAWDGLPASGGVRDHLAELGVDANEVQGRLARARIALVDLAPVTHLVARHLSAAGVGELVLFDGDVTDDYDESKVVTIDPALRKARPRGEGASEESPEVSWGATRAVRWPVGTGSKLEEARAVLDQVDLAVVRADDQGGWARAFNLACIQGGSGRMLPYTLSSRQSFVGPLVEGTPPCYVCAESRRLSHMQHHAAFEVYRRALDAGTTSAPAPAVLAPHAAIVAGIVAVESLRIAGRFSTAVTTGAVLTADTVTLEVHRENVLSVPDCAACGGVVTVELDS